jgi:uncharacterized protein
VRTASHPRLYDPLAELPVLNGTQCQHCGRLYFPSMGIGCEICGAPADQLLPKPLPTIGTVHALAQVHVHYGPEPTPFTIAEIVLDAGPLIRAMIHPASDPLDIGDRVSARWHVTGLDDGGNAIVEPAFAPEGQATTTTPPDASTGAVS